MRLFAIVAAAIHLSTACAYSIKEATVKVNSKAIHFGEVSTQEVKSLPIQSTKDKLDITIKLNDDQNSVPHQAIVVLGNDNGIEFPLFPKYNAQAKTLRLVTLVSKLPDSVKSLERIFIKAIVANPGSADNLSAKLGELVPSNDLKDYVNHQKPSRIGIQPEITHTFNEEPSTVNPIFPIVFIGGGLTLFFALIGSWVHFLGRDFFGTLKRISSTQLLNNASFLTCLLAFEFLFVKYYLGASIFQVIAYSAGLAGPTIYLGSRTFSLLAHLRKIGKA